MNVEQVAETCHEANRVLQRHLGEPVAREWSDFSEREREGVIAGVELALSGESDPSKMHESWVLGKLEDGWRYGPELDREAKTHPNLLPYHELDKNQWAKDDLFLAIISALEGLMDPKEIA